MEWSTIIRINGKHFTVLEMYFWTANSLVKAYLLYLYEFTNKKMGVYAQQMKNYVTSPGFCTGKHYFCIRGHPFRTSENFMQFYPAFKWKSTSPLTMTYLYQNWCSFQTWQVKYIKDTFGLWLNPCTTYRRPTRQK